MFVLRWFHGPGSASVSVRAAILALGQFRIAPPAEVKLLEKRWNKYRASTGCDLYGNKHTS